MRELIESIKKSNEDLEMIKNGFNKFSRKLEEERENFNYLEKAIETVLSTEDQRKVLLEYRNNRYPHFKLIGEVVEIQATNDDIYKIKVTECRQVWIHGYDIERQEITVPLDKIKNIKLGEF